MHVTVRLEQITQGSEYKGTLEGIGVAPIEYNLCFGVPIDQLDFQKMPDDPEKAFLRAKELFNFKVTKQGNDIEITNEVFGFMMQAAAQVAISFYNNGQSQDYNSGGGLLSDAIEKKGSSFLGQLGMQVSIGMSCQFEVDEVHIPKLLMD